MKLYITNQNVFNMVAWYGRNIQIQTVLSLTTQGKQSVHILYSKNVQIDFEYMQGNSF